VKVLAALSLLALALVLTAGGNLTAADKADLKVGDPAPTFEAQDDQGKTWKSADHVGKKIIVVYFYPADCTGGCTMQARGFRDDADKLAGKGVEVIGVSGDSVDNHKLFKKVENLNFTLLADDKGELAKKFGVPMGKGGTFKFKDKEGNVTDLVRGVTIQRWTFVIGKDGKIAHKDTKVNAKGDSKKILDVVEKLNK
jgi:peroxiredoxin Q/BCP